jgi:hypothetical protein
MFSVREAVLPLTAQQASAAVSLTTQRALFFYRRRHRIDQICAAALTKAPIIEQPKRNATVATDWAFHPDSQICAPILRPDESDRVQW